MVTTATSSAPLIEKHTIGYVPPEDRHGKVRDLFTLWFGGNIAPLPIVTGALGVQLGGSAAPGITPDRSKTFEAGSDAEATRADGSTPGQLPQLGHLQSVVGLVWRSVVLWMLLLALLTLANLVG